MELLELMKKRRSVREYAGEPIDPKAIEQVLQAGLLSPSGRARQPWEFIVVRNKETLKKLSQCREHGAAMLANADCAIVVFADPSKTDVWTEDCSIAMSNMHLMAESLGIGSCWIQGRLRTAPDGRLTKTYLQELLQVPAELELEAILSMGMPKEHKAPHSLEDLPTQKIHLESFTRE